MNGVATSQAPLATVAGHCSGDQLTTVRFDREIGWTLLGDDEKATAAFGIKHHANGAHCGKKQLEKREAKQKC